ncbi:hypothetical protein K0B96_09775 [Horticoccus luteus]|uniref:RHS repeat-associated core domain-containing protein n=1 Tax=Horticoccus luteus TaxID=2862869 RepID=A0A8F9TT83_9BACT|nr:hypothetical protein K0B96_09775 [Horticoccus luteus]
MLRVWRRFPFLDLVDPSRARRHLTPGRLPTSAKPAPGFPLPLPATASCSYGARATNPPELAIHMNGRVYDPTLGRFLSADPVVDDREDCQSFNRYSYVNNNPLTFARRIPAPRRHVRIPIERRNNLHNRPNRMAPHFPISRRVRAAREVLFKRSWLPSLPP